LIGGVFVISVMRQRIDSGRLDERALSIGMFIAPLVAVSPIADVYHDVMILPAILIAWWWALRGSAARRDWVVLALCTGLVCVPQRFYGSAQLRNGWAALLAYPRVYGSLILWGFLARALDRSRRR